MIRYLDGVEQLEVTLVSCVIAELDHIHHYSLSKIQLALDWILAI